MIPKEKAEELVRKMCLNDCRDKNIDLAKKCALIAVDEILNYDNEFIQTQAHEDYWQEIRKEIEKI